MKLKINESLQAEPFLPSQMRILVQLFSYRKPTQGSSNSALQQSLQLATKDTERPCRQKPFHSENGLTDVESESLALRI